jgi:hypothetical protein
VSACPVIISERTPWNTVNEAGCGYALSLTDKNAFVKLITELVDMENDKYNPIWKNCINFMSVKADQKAHKDAYLNLFS